MHKSISGAGRFPTTRDIAPGQSDEQIDLFINARHWIEKDDDGNVSVKTLHSPSAAKLVYAGILGRAAPDQQDYDDAEKFERDRQAWRASLTERQRELLDVAKEYAQEKRRNESRQAYADKVGRPVRPYQRNATAEHKKAMERARQARFLDKMSPEERKEYERKRKAAYREAKKRLPSETAEESPAARLMLKDEQSSAKMDKAPQRSVMAISESAVLNILLERPADDLTAEEQDRLQALLDLD